MKAAQGAPAVVVGEAALGDRRVEPVGLELTAAPGAGEETPLVLKALWFQDPGAGERSLAEDHSKTRTSGMATTKRPPQERTSAICSMISSFRFQGRIRT